jgi:predicted DNA-binding transcriptional regulator YafY
LHAPYVITKPLHHSQKVIEENERGLTIELALQINFELEKEILGFGDGVEVLAPLKLRKVIQGRLSRALKYYQS